MEERLRFQRLDLNLLVALDVLLRERSVSLAADRLCLSQSATSSALGRLRDYFGDELLVQKGRQLVLTPRAEALIEPVRAVLEQIRTTVAVAPPFDPATCDKQIRIMASDYTTEVLLTHALAEFADEAPAMRFEIQSMQSEPVDALDRGLVDLILSVDFALSSDHPRRELFDDDFVVIGDVENEALSQPMTPELFLSLGHVTVRFGRSRVPTFEEWFLRRQRHQRRIEVVAPTFLSVLGLIIGTKRVAVLHRLLAERLAEHPRITLRELPFDIPPIRESVQWSASTGSDSALQWVVNRLEAIARERLRGTRRGKPLVEVALAEEFMTPSRVTH